MEQSNVISLPDRFMQMLPELSYVSYEVLRRHFEYPETDISGKRMFDIKYLELTGAPTTYKNPHFNPERNDTVAEFKQFKRYRLANPEDGRKYSQPPGSGNPPFLNGILEYMGGIPDDERLFIVEGEKKAFAMCHHGLPTIGIGGKDNFRDDYLLELCKDKEIYLVHDADAKDNRGNLKPNFGLTVTNFFKHFKHSAKSVHYGIVSYGSDVIAFKGIDDAILHYRQNQNENPSADDILENIVPVFNKIDHKVIENISRLANVEYQIYDYLDRSFDWRHNIITKMVEVKPKADNEWMPLSDQHIHALGFDLRAKLRIKASNTQIDNVIDSESICDEPRLCRMFNPFTALMEQETNKNYAFIVKFLKTAVILEDPKQMDLFISIFIKWMVNHVRQQYEPVPNRIVPVFKSFAQSTGKSMFARFMGNVCGPDYFTDTWSIHDGKDADLALASKFLINLDDLESYTPKDMAKLKTKISAGTQSLRLPYGKRATVLKRRASFIGSTNKDFLTDSSNFRFLVFEIKEMNWREYTKFDPADLWAAAHKIYEQWKFNGMCEWELTPAEKNLQENINLMATGIAEEYELIEQYFVKDETASQRLRRSDVITELRKHMPRVKPHAVSDALRSLGYSPRKIRGKVIWDIKIRSTQHEF